MYRKTKQEKQGISLIVLVITIIVIIIIAAAVILGLTKSNPINNSKISQLVQSRDNIKSSITMYLSKVASNTQGSFTNIQMLTGLLGVPNNEDPIIKQGAEKYKLVYGKNSTPSYNVGTKIMYTQRTEVKLENGSTKYVYQIDPTAYKTQTENTLDSAMFADAAWYVDPDDTQVYLIFNNQGSYPNWMLENGVIADPTLLGMLGKLSEEDQTNEQAKQEAEITVTEDSKPYSPISEVTSEGVPIPKGFSLSTNVNEKTIATGVVIIDNVTKDEFVWVPVITPLISNNYDVISSQEFKDMQNSVNQYKGYYIARYEAGMPDNQINPPVDGSVKPVSKPNKNVWRGTGWDITYSYSDKLPADPEDSRYAGDPESGGAPKIARSMYPKSSDASVVSTLIYGAEWNAVKNYLSDIVNLTEEESPLYINNAKGMGWYPDNYKSGNATNKTGIPIYQGDTILNAPKNIYDLAGNVFEWTMEGYPNSGGRMVRGGGYTSDFGSEYMSFSGVQGRNPAFKDRFFGFRVALYIK